MIWELFYNFKNSLRIEQGNKDKHKKGKIHIEDTHAHPVSTQTQAHKKILPSLIPSKMLYPWPIFYMRFKIKTICFITIYIQNNESKFNPEIVLVSVMEKKKIIKSLWTACSPAKYFSIPGANS